MLRGARYQRQPRGQRAALRPADLSPDTRDLPRLELAYPKPAEIGQDRIANAIAVQEYHGVPAIILDMGTAVTFDIITSAGYEGGIIAPGLAVMTRYLHEQTALLPELSEADLLNVEGAIGKSTVHAMKLGVAIGFSGMVDALLARVLAELKARGEAEPVVLSTGGSIANLTQDWAQKSLFVERPAHSMGAGRGVSDGVGPGTPNDWTSSSLLRQCQSPRLADH